MSNIEYIFQADNPLGRNVIRTDIYHMAEQSRMLCVPGSDVEDRQYQIDITGFSINTCMWKEIDSCLGYVISITRKNKTCINCMFWRNKIMKWVHY